MCLLSSLQHLQHGAAERRWRVRDGEASASHRLHLVLSGAGAAGNNRARVAHAAARGCGDARDEADNGLLYLAALDEIGGFFLGRAADLADHDDRLSLVILEEEPEHIDEIGAVDGIAADADAARLAEPCRRRLRDGLISESAGAGDDADVALRMDVAGHDAD